MTTLVFVHGTGVRSSSYAASLNEVTSVLKEKRPDVVVHPCCWGDLEGARLRAEGASVPLYDATRDTTEDAEVKAETAYLIALWEQLYKDPLYELRVLSLVRTQASGAVPGQRPPGEVLDLRVRRPPTDALRSKLIEAGIGNLFDDAKSDVVNSPEYREALKTTPQANGARHLAIARAIVAQAVSRCERQGMYAPVLVDAALRDELVAALVANAGGDQLAVGDWAAKRLFDLAVAMGAMDYVKRRRGAITDASYPAAGDILLYQARGEAIRAFIRQEIRRAQPPVVVLAHSLGGIACVDLLVAEAIPEVELLVTAGSQAPFLYEINALWGLRHGEPLPAHFPSWLNLYDLRDFLSYVGANVFPNRVQDVAVDSRMPFPRSHGAYWTNPATWKAIIPRLP